MVQRSWLAVGAAALKRTTWNQDRESAMSLDTPGTWHALTRKLFHGSKGKESEKVHNAKGFRMTWIDDSNHRLIVTPEL